MGEFDAEFDCKTFSTKKYKYTVRYHDNITTRHSKEYLYNINLLKSKFAVLVK
jgi:hypothetical protein